MRLHFLNDVINEVESTGNDNYVIIARLKKEPTC